jgi:hypothetical protein
MASHTALQQNLRGHLQNLLRAKQLKNAQYSLRAFSRSLGIPHSTLSLYFRGQRQLSRPAIQKICEHIDWKGEEVSTLLQTPANPDSEFHTLELDQYESMSDWVHFAILSLTKISSFKIAPENIAERLGIEESYASDCMERLIRLGILEKARNGKWIQSTLPLKVDNKVSTAATRKAQRMLIEKSVESLENDAFEDRDFNAVMFAMDRSLVPLAKEKIRKFRRKLMTELESAGAANEVYTFSMQLFPVSKKKESI